MDQEPETVDCTNCRGRGWEYTEGRRPDLPPLQVECRVCFGLGFEVVGDDENADDSRHSAPYDLGRALPVTLPAA